MSKIAKCKNCGKGLQYDKDVQSWLHIIGHKWLCGDWGRGGNAAEPEVEVETLIDLYYENRATSHPVL